MAALKNPPDRPGQAALVDWPVRGDRMSVSLPMPTWSMPMASTSAEVDDDAQPVTLLDDGRAEGGQAAQAGGLGVDVAERLDLIAFIVQQLEVLEPALVHL